MKIIVTDNNYGNEADGHPAWFLLTHSCLLRDNRPLYLPRWDSDFRLYPSMAIRIDRLGKSIPQRFAHRYWDHWSFGFSLRGAQSLRHLYALGLPGGAATAFDNSAVIAGWHQLNCRERLPEMKFTIHIDSTEAGRWQYASLHYDADSLLSLLSTRMTFKTGDILYLGFPGEGIPLARDCRITVNEEGKRGNDTIYTEISGFNVKADNVS